jgi:hypothetical protein
VALGVLVLATAGCGLVARDHACWPYVSYRYHGHVPSPLVHLLAHEHGTVKEVGHHQAPPGWYWRRRGGGSLDAGDVHTLMGGYELARCPTAALVPPQSNVPALPVGR